MAIYEVPISQFPGGVAPASFVEFVQRVKDDGGISKTVISPELKYSDYGGAPKVKLYFNSALSPAEETIVNNLAAAAPGSVAASVATLLANFSGEGYRGFFIDRGAATTTAGGSPAVRVDESYGLAGGKYLIVWSAIVYGTAASTDLIARFVFDRGGGDELIVPFAAEGEDENVFSGEDILTLPEATKSFELEIEHNGGGGSAAMKESSIRYRWVGSA